MSLASHNYGPTRLNDLKRGDFIYYGSLPIPVIGWEHTGKGRILRIDLSEITTSDLRNFYFLGSDIHGLAVEFKPSDLFRKIMAFDGYRAPTLSLWPEEN